MGHRHQLRALIEQRLVLIHQQLAGIIDWNHAQPGALLFAEHLPRDDVRVVLHGRDDDLIAGANELATITMHDEIDAFGSAAHEDTFLYVARVDEALHLFARSLISSRRPHAQIVHPAMNVRVFLLKILRAAFNHNGWDLRRRGIVQIHERLAVNVLGQYGKVFANALDIPRFARLWFNRY